jgi:hypothetical protein
MVAEDESSDAPRIEARMLTAESSARGSSKGSAARRVIKCYDMKEIRAPRVVGKASLALLMTLAEHRHTRRLAYNVIAAPQNNFHKVMRYTSPRRNNRHRATALAMVQLAGLTLPDVAISLPRPLQFTKLAIPEEPK